MSSMSTESTSSTTQWLRLHRPSPSIPPEDTGNPRLGGDKPQYNAFPVFSLMRPRRFWFICLYLLFVSFSNTIPFPCPILRLTWKGGFLMTFQSHLTVQRSGWKSFNSMLLLLLLSFFLLSPFSNLPVLFIHSLYVTHYFGLFGYFWSARIRNIRGCRWAIDWQPRPQSRPGLVSLWLRLIICDTSTRHD